MRKLLRAIMVLALICVNIKTYALEGFYGPGESSLNLSIEQSVRARSYRLEVGASAFKHCSGQFISDTGHFLTALHCLDFNPRIITALNAELSKPQGITFMRIREQVPSRELSFFVTVKSQAKDVVYRGQAQIVLTGSGMSSQRPDLTMSPSEDLIPRFKEVGGDFAILKLDINSAETCMPISNTPSDQALDIWGVGYPKQTLRNNGKGSDGVSLYITQGSIYRDMSFNKDVSNFSSYIQSLFTQSYITQQRYVSDMDAFSNMSGGMAVNANGEIQGIIVGGRSSQSKYLAVSTEIVDIKHIVMASKQLLSNGYNDLFSCSTQIR